MNSINNKIILGIIIAWSLGILNFLGFEDGNVDNLCQNFLHCVRTSLSTYVEIVVGIIFVISSTKLILIILKEEVKRE